MQTFRAVTLDPGQLRMFEDRSMNLQSSQNTSSCFFCSQCISASYLCYLFKVIVSFLQRTCSVQRLPHSCVFAQKGFSMIFNPVQYLPKEKNVQLPVLSRQHRATLGVRMRQLQRHCLMSAAVKHTEICQCPLWPNGRYICIDVAGKLGLLDPCYSICFKV